MKDIEQEFKDKIPNIAVGYRGILLDQYDLKLVYGPPKTLHTDSHLCTYYIFAVTRIRWNSWYT